MPLKISGIKKSFGRFPALSDASLVANDGEFLALLGPSGSGKTTLLRIIAGLETAEGGTISFNGEDMLAKPVRERGIGFVFQHYALFRHMTVLKNIGFGLRSRPRRTRPITSAINARTNELLGLVQLDGLGDRYPSQLSGGQRQRVALARALAIEPTILLLDEPFGALDAKVRRELRRWLRELHEETGLTTIFVTHDQEEALELADRVAILKDGQVEQIGTPQELYDNPVSPFVFDFLGDSTRFPCQVVNGRAEFAGLSVTIEGPKEEGPAVAYVRPEDFELGPEDGPGLGARVRDILKVGREARLSCILHGDGVVDLKLSHEKVAGLEPRRGLKLKPTVVRVWQE